MHSGCKCVNVACLLRSVDAESLRGHTFALRDDLIEFTFLLGCEGESIESSSADVSGRCREWAEPPLLCRPPRPSLR